MVVEVDEAAIAPHLKRLADVARRHGVQGPTELDVVIGMDRAACPRQAINWGMLLRNLAACQCLVSRVCRGS